MGPGPSMQFRLIIDKAKVFGRQNGIDLFLSMNCLFHQVSVHDLTIGFGVLLDVGIQLNVNLGWHLVISLLASSIVLINS